ncbi:MAG: transglycosylase domain-containing protein [Oligoflexales bacterium]
MQVYPPQDLQENRRFSSLRIILVTLAVVIGASAFCGFRWLRNLGLLSSEFTELNTITGYEPADATVVFDRNGGQLGEVFSKYQIFVPYEQIPPLLINAIVAVEDRNFFEHQGVDFKAIGRAIYERFTRGEIQGASTITQQVVRHFLLSKERSFERKAKEILLAINLEKKLSKQKILEIYANSMFLGNGAYGVGAAAQKYFSRDLKDLSESELILMAGLFQSPSRLNPVKYLQRAKVRQKHVLRTMIANRMLTKKRATLLVSQAVRLKPLPANRDIAPFFLDYIEELTQKFLKKNIKNQGLRIYTTLDPSLQRKAEVAIAQKSEQLTSLEKYLNVNTTIEQPSAPNPIEATLLSIHPQTGEILAMVGGRDYERSQFNRAVHARRQVGSLFKPIVYSLALSRGFRWSDLMYVSKIVIDGYEPQNYSHQYLTETTMLKAFYDSINTPAVEVGYKLGLTNIIEHSRKLGIKSPIREELGTILGSAELTPLEVATAYGTFANNGTVVKPIAIFKITDREGKVLYSNPKAEARSKKVLAPEVAFLMAEGMRNVFTYGTASSYPEMGRFAAGKTGTSNDARDNWFCGFTKDLTTVVWVGSESNNAILRNASGNTLALPMWADFMKSVDPERAVEPFPFEQPTNIVSALVNPEFGHLDPEGILMYFIKGTEPTKTRSDLQHISRSGGYRNLFK